MTDAENRAYLSQKYISVLQERFPNVLVAWNPPPHRIFETQPCAITFTSKTDPNSKCVAEFNDGLGAVPTEADIEILLNLYADTIDGM